jgi:hypothetical protein
MFPWQQIIHNQIQQKYAFDSHCQILDTANKQGSC